MLDLYENTRKGYEPIVSPNQRFKEDDVRALAFPMLPVGMRLCKRGLPNANWYGSTNKLMRELFPSDWINLCGVIAVTSPQCHVLLNVRRAYSVMKHGIHGLSIPGMACPRSIKQACARYLHDGYIGGIKTRAFRNNLLGLMDDVCIDTWIFQAFGHKHTSHPNLAWHAIDRTIRACARAYGLQPAQAQAAIWYGIMVESGRKTVPQMSTYLMREYPTWFMFDDPR